MKHPAGWYMIHYDGQNLWIDGRRKRNPETYTAIIAAIKARKVDLPVDGQVEILENGETTFYEEFNDD